MKKSVQTWRICYQTRDSNCSSAKWWSVVHEHTSAATGNRRRTLLDDVSLVRVTSRVRLTLIRLVVVSTLRVARTLMSLTRLTFSHVFRGQIYIPLLCHTIKYGMSLSPPIFATVIRLVLICYLWARCCKEYDIPLEASTMTRTSRKSILFLSTKMNYHTTKSNSISYNDNCDRNSKIIATHVDMWLGTLTSSHC